MAGDGDGDGSVPAWQRAQPADEKDTDNDTGPGAAAAADLAPAPTPQELSAEADAAPSLDQARKFLADQNVQAETNEKKTEFLRSKGFSDSQIQELLLSESLRPLEARDAVPQDSSQEAPEASPGAATTTTTTTSTTTTAAEAEAEAEAEAAPAQATGRDAPPIITYPEFLTKSPKPPPLITPDRLLSILTVSGSVWALLYGTARFVVNPLVENLNESRADYYGHVSDKLGHLVRQLEGAVSEVPYKDGKPVRPRTDDAQGGGYTDLPDDDDDESVASDPTELFHRDMGTQTSPPPSLLANPAATTAPSPSPDSSVVDRQAHRLAALRASLRELNDMYTRQAEETENVSAALREVRDEVDKVSYPAGAGAGAAAAEYGSLHGGIGFGRGEPDDEFKKTKDAIRSVKGLFLSSRSFPAALAAK